MKKRTNGRTKVRICLALIAVAVAWISVPLCTAQDAKKAETASPFDSLKKTYAAINSLEAGFHQKIYVSGIKKIRDFDGEFFFKRHKGFLWKYTKPKGKTFLYDGRFMWQDEEDKPFVLKNKVSREKTGGTFFDLVEDIAKIDDLFTVKQQSVIAGMQYFELVPKKDSSVNMAKLWIDKNNI
ncbi:MAG: outer membrane lipoprotein carrier protein LolA, partial [Deltaproteobacteria bacterium]|nr:outer membrane lipoprotein carrier protein LolA [Deltaproteobacteria bacterium]